MTVDGSVDPALSDHDDSHEESTYFDANSNRKYPLQEHFGTVHKNRSRCSFRG